MCCKRVELRVSNNLLPQSSRHLPNSEVVVWVSGWDGGMWFWELKNGYFTKTMIVEPFCAGVYAPVSLPWILLRAASWHTTIAITTLWDFQTCSRFFRFGGGNSKQKSLWSWRFLFLETFLKRSGPQSDSRFSSVIPLSCDQSAVIDVHVLVGEMWVHSKDTRRIEKE